MKRKELNQVVLSGIVSKKDAMRYTPSGVPLLQVRLDHDLQKNDVIQAITLSLILRAFGVVASELNLIEVGTEIAVNGYLAPKQKNSYSLVLCVNQFKLM